MKDPWLHKVCVALGWQGGTIHQVIAEIERLRAQRDQARQALLDYYFALDSRKHGDVAAVNAIRSLENTLGECWVPGAELALRAERAGGQAS